jgi:hypothetical protein
VAAFETLDWTRIDLWAIVNSGGVATTEEGRRDECLRWLRRHGYEIDSFDCAGGVASLVVELGRFFRWEEQFGYALTVDRRNLDALRDGFEFQIPDGGGRVMELLRADLAWGEEPDWLLGLVSIAMEHSRQQLALGRRFFVLLTVPDSLPPPVNQIIEEARVPGPFRSGFPDHRFLD